MKKRTLTLVVALLLATAAFSQNSMNKGAKAASILKRSTSDRIDGMSNLSKSEFALKDNKQSWYDNFFFSHDADTIVIHNWDKERNLFEHFIRETYVKKDGKINMIVREIPWENSYLAVEKETYNYTKTGMISEIIVHFWDISSNLWKPASKIEYIYDDFGNKTLEVNSQWNSNLNNWQAYFKFSVKFVSNSNCSPLLIEAYYWSLFHDENIWHPSFREEYIYDKSGKLTLMIYSIPDGQEFIETQKEVYIYKDNSDIFTGAIILNYYNDEWVVDFKIDDIKWHCFKNRLPETYTLFISDDLDGWKNDENTDWMPFLRSNYTYHSELNVETYYIEEITFGYDWQSYFRRVTTYNSSNFRTRYLEQFNTFGWESWQTDYGYSFDGMYNEKGQPLNVILSVYDLWEEQWENRYNFEFRYKKDIPSSTAELSTNQFAKLHPNPSSNYTLLTLNNPSSNVEVEFFSLKGQLVKSFVVPVNINEKSIDISNLNNGVYLVRLRMGGFIQTTKLVKY
jgi:hypothetical protein